LEKSFSNVINFTRCMIPRHFTPERPFRTLCLPDLAWPSNTWLSYQHRKIVGNSSECQLHSLQQFQIEACLLLLLFKFPKGPGRSDLCTVQLFMFWPTQSITRSAQSWGIISHCTKLESFVFLFISRII